MAVEGITVLKARPGELTLAVARLQGNDELARSLEASLGAVNGILQVRAEAAEGVVHLRYDRQTLTSLWSLWALKDAVSSLFPEVNPLELAALLSKHL